MTTYTTSSCSYTTVSSPSSVRSRSRESTGSPSRSSSSTTLYSPSPPLSEHEHEHEHKAESQYFHPHTLTKIDEKLEKRVVKNDGRPLLSFEDAYFLMPWQMDNPAIRTGYRRPTGSYRGCAISIVGYLHNETVNILSHFLGGLFFFSLLPLHLLPQKFPWIHPSSRAEYYYPTPHTLHDTVAMCVQLGATAACFGLSSGFHTLSCHSRKIGIVVLIVGSVTPSMYYAFYGNPVLQIFYITSMVMAGLVSGFIVLSPHHRANRWHRTLTFMGLGASALIPTIHVLATQGLAHARSVMSLDLVIAAGVIYIIGALIYAARIPESLSPGSFDFFFSSHQIFHVLVVVGAGLQYAALRGMVFGRAMAVGRAMAEADAAAMAVADAQAGVGWGQLVETLGLFKGVVW